MRSKLADVQEITTFRESLYRLFSECLLRPPGGAVAAAWQDPEWRGSLARLLDLPLSILPRNGELSDELELATEFARLFVVPATMTCPFESYHRIPWPVEDAAYGSLLACATHRVQQIYRSWRARPEAETEEVPDHAATELRFMAMLVALERQVRAAGDDGLLAATLHAQADFLDEHILAWFPAWMATVQARARLPYYRSLVEVLLRFLEVDRNTLESIVAARS